MVGEVTIVTPEYVEIHLTPAGLGRRFVAWLIDMLVLMSLIMFARMLGALGGWVGTFASTTIIFLIVWGYHVFFDLIWQGRTPAKRALGLRVIDDRGLPLSLQQSFVRNIVRIFDMLPGGGFGIGFYGVGATVCLFNPAARRLGDIAAGTLVVHEARPLEAPRQLTEGWRHNSLRTGRMLRTIRNRVSLEEREFLLSLCVRSPKLDDKARFDLMEEVGAHYREKLGIEDAHLSGENLVRGLASVLFEKQ